MKNLLHHKVKIIEHPFKLFLGGGDRKWLQTREAFETKTSL